MPIILCTGYSEIVDANIASQSGLMGFMYKPLEIPKLLSLIQERLLHARPAP
jgi:DNA-binding NtrC family response regulator